MRGPDRLERAAALLEGLLADPQLRAQFRHRPGRTCRGFDLPELATELETGRRGTLPLERRESRSSLAGAMIAVAAEGIGLVETVVSQGGPDAGAHWPAERVVGGRSAVAASAVPEPDRHVERLDGARSAVAAPGASEPDRPVAPADEGPAPLKPVAPASGPAAYPGDDASRAEIASWMARRAAAAGIPEQLPVIAALGQSDLSHPPSHDHDAAGFFRMSREAWDRGPYRGFAEDPDLQLAWFLDRAAIIRAEHVAAGDSTYGQDPSSWHEWISAAVERPGAHRAGDGGPLGAAQRLLDGAQPAPNTEAESSIGSTAAQRAVQIAEQYLGQPYRWGGASPATGFDCSGLVQYAYGQAGVPLPRVTDQQFAVGDLVGRDELRSGDIVFFRDATGYIHHEGIYLSADQFLHAPHSGDVIKVSSLEEPYYAQQFAGGRRVGQLAEGPAATG